MKEIYLMKLKMGSKLDKFKKETFFLYAVMQIKKKSSRATMSYNLGDQEQKNQLKILY